MAITPRHTLAEVNRKIVLWEACVDALAAGESYTITIGGSSQTYKTHNLDAVEKKLDRLYQQRAEIESSGRSAVLVGRPAR